MLRSTASALLFLIAGEFCALAQVGRYPGGGYPPGSYPPGTYPPNTGGGIPWPRRGKDKKSRQEQDQVPQQTLQGTLRRLNASEVVLEPEDKRILTAAVSNTTKYFRNLDDAAASDFHPGDKISVDVTEDGKGYFHALRITLDRTGSPAERAAASRPADVSPVTDGDSDRSGSPDADDERPRLRRQPQGRQVESRRPEKATAKAGDAKAEAPKPEEEPEQIISTVTVINPADNRPDPEDGSPPKLRRGVPPKRTTTQTASSQPPRSATAPIGVPRLPSPESDTPRAADTVIERAREAADSFGESLPNYLVKQVTTRFFAQNGSARGTTWQPRDNVTTDVVYENGKESYKNILINGRPPKQKVEKTGAWSTGEFGTVLRDLFSSATNARFRRRGSDRIVNREAYQYEFAVEQPNSHWHVYMAAQSYLPAYKGSVWIDKENYRVLRLEMQAQNLPSEFPLDTVESATDYDYVRIGGQSFLLPVHSEALSCIRGSGDCSRNVIDFRNYRKFGSEANITFDDAVKP